MTIFPTFQTDVIEQAAFTPARANTPVLKTGALWTADDDAVLTRMRREGESAQDIAFALGRTRATVYTRLRKLGVLVEAHRAWSDAAWAKAVALLREGARVADAAAAVGRTESELRSRLADRGLSAREMRPKQAKPIMIRDAKTPRAAIARTRLSDAERRAIKAAALEKARAAKAAKPTQALKWTPERVADLVALWKGGETDLARLADRFGSTKRMIDTILRKAGARALKRARFGLTGEKKATAVARLTAGETITRVARDLRVDLRTLKAGLGDKAAAFARQSALTREARIVAARAERVAVARRERQVRHDAERMAREVEKARIAEQRLAAQARAREEAEAVRIEKIRIAEAARKAKEVAPKVAVKPVVARPVAAKVDSASVKPGAVDALKAALARRALAKGSSTVATAPAASRTRAIADDVAAQTAPAQVKFVSRAAQDALKPADPKKWAGFRARRAAQPTLDAAETARLVAAHMATRGVTRIVEIGDEALLGGLRRRGYVVLAAKGGWTIDDRLVATTELEAFAAARGVHLREDAA